VKSVTEWGRSGCPSVQGCETLTPAGGWLVGSLVQV